MADLASTLVVLIDADDVKHVFANWPDHICLATCLTRNGECRMVVFRRDERIVIHQRLMRILQIGADKVCFVPHVSGFATKKFKYSDERRLMALVASDPGLLDDAIDYSVNYTYALEEGLDPAVILGQQTVEVQVPRRPVAPLATSLQREQPAHIARGELSPLLPDFLRKSAERARRPKFASIRKTKVGMLMPQT
jgi:hypothetical protein